MNWQVFFLLALKNVTPLLSIFYDLSKSLNSFEYNVPLYPQIHIHVCGFGGKGGHLSCIVFSELHACVILDFL